MAAHAPAINSIVADQQKYASQHDLPGVFEALLIALLFAKPAAPLTFIAEELRRIHGAKTFSTDTPGREVDTEDGATQYLSGHHINDVLEELFAGVLYAQPAEPLLFLADECARLQSGKAHATGAYSDGDLKGMFSLFDASGRGVITVTQVATAFRNLGIKAQPRLEAGTVDVDAFVAAARAAIAAEQHAPA